MERLSGLDAGFLYMETPTLHMHTLKLAILRPPEPAGASRADGAHGTDGGGADLAIDHVRERVLAKLAQLPPLRRRVVAVPLDLHHPVWIEDPDLAIERHVHQVELPAPGGRAELEAAVGELAGTPLDRTRPLWEMHVLRGLADGRIAVLVKVHHAVADGTAAAHLLANVMSTSPDEDAPPDGAWGGEPVPSGSRMLRDALGDHAVQLRRVPGLAVRTLQNLASVARHRRGARVRPPRPVLDTPRTRFNAGLTPHRAFATTILSLADVRAVRDRFAVSVNDVVLALTAGALRAYLLERDALPDRPLVAAVPISTGAGDEHRLGGNQVANLFTTLATDEPDPVARLQRIHDVTTEAKLVQELLGVDMLRDWVAFTPPAPYRWLVRQHSRLNLADHHPPPVNVVVSNVPGPRAPLFADGARLDELYSVGPVLEGIGVNVTVWSYLDHLYVGVLGCREHLPDPQELVGAMPTALAELRAAAGVPAAMV